jgi:hypothetical protein
MLAHLQCTAGLEDHVEGRPIGGLVDRKHALEAQLFSQNVHTLLVRRVASIKRHHLVMMRAKPDTFGKRTFARMRAMFHCTS